jgi:hypothetical protein
MPLKFTRINILLLVVCLLLCFSYIYYVLHEFDGLHFYPPGGRDPESFKSSLSDFLNYNGTPTIIEIINDFVLGKSFFGDLMLYVGILPILFFIFSLFKITSINYRALLAGFVFLGSIALGGIVAELVYHLPLFSYYRHIGYLWGLNKVLIVFCSGFFLEYFIDSLLRVLTPTHKSKLGLPNLSDILKGLPIIFLGVCLIFFISQKHLFQFNYFQFIKGYDPDIYTQLINLRVFSFIILIAGLVIFAVFKRKYFTQVFCIGVVLYVLIDLISFKMARLDIYQKASEQIHFETTLYPLPWSFRPYRPNYPVTERDKRISLSLGKQAGILSMSG